MSSAAIRMIKTAGTILRQEGPVALTRAVIRRLSRPAVAAQAPAISPAPDESDIAFEVLGGDRLSGTMVDVGAHYGGALERFAQSQWQVYAFEPDSQNRTHLKARFGDAPNVRIDARAVSDKDDANVPLFRSEESTGISGLSAFRPTHRQCETVDITTLAHLAGEQSIEQIDFLKIDTEGFDLFVLRGVPWERIQPRLILCEFEDRKTVPLGYTFHDLARYLEEQGYSVLVSEWYPIERYGIKHRWRRFVPYPCDLADTQAWGNLLAAKEPLYGALVEKCLQGDQK